jgi:hypothetical protein
VECSNTKVLVQILCYSKNMVQLLRSIREHHPRVCSIFSDGVPRKSNLNQSRAESEVPCITQNQYGLPVPTSKPSNDGSNSQWAKERLCSIDSGRPERLQGKGNRKSQGRSTSQASWQERQSGNSESSGDLHQRLQITRQGRQLA